MPKILIGLYFIGATIAMAQVQYQIQDFSKNYSAILNIDSNQENNVFKKGNIRIFEKQTKKEIIQIQSNEFAFEINKKGEIEANVLELPYGKQSVLIYQDFNFDGQKDLAIMDGQFSCYHGPSYQIYLETKDGLQHSPEFTRLAQDYCGMFQVNKQNKTIHTMTKSGCCWHQFSTFVVENNQPQAIKIVEHGMGKNYIVEEYTEWNRIDGQMVKQQYRYLAPQGDFVEVFTMQMNNGKQMGIFRAFAFEDYLFYVFMDKEEKIELLFTGDFIYNPNKPMLSFTNKEAEYQIEPDGIRVITAKKEIKIPAKQPIDKQSFAGLKELRLKNLMVVE